MAREPPGLIEETSWRMVFWKGLFVLEAGVIWGKRARPLQSIPFIWSPRGEQREWRVGAGLQWALWWGHLISLLPLREGWKGSLPWFCLQDVILFVQIVDRQTTVESAFWVEGQCCPDRHSCSGDTRSWELEAMLLPSYWPECLGKGSMRARLAPYGAVSGR